MISIPSALRQRMKGNGMQIDVEILVNHSLFDKGDDEKHTEKASSETGAGENEISVSR